MANDPNRDLLPVKEDNYKIALNQRIDHQILAKLSRCDLEDRLLRLLDEQTQLKKVVNYQEEKIKRLGTKLLRLVNEKKSGRKSLDQTKEADDLHLRIVELEHDNYVLKDKNTALKQQLASHSRHITVHCSPARSNHTSPLISMRPSTQTARNDIVYDTTSKTTAAEVQLQEAEIHIKELNEEIKSLRSKIDCLQQDLERSSLDNRKTKVTENIELIRLQRALKQQAIQIAALQAQVKNSENNQKLLREELTKAHNENDEALHLISLKQNEILNLCCKLEEKNLNRLEEEELKERINDLMLERDALKKRSELLMKTIELKAEETEQINELKKLLAEEKLKKEKFEEALRISQAAQCSIKKTVVETNESDFPENRNRTVNNSSNTDPYKTSYSLMQNVVTVECTNSLCQNLSEKKNADTCENPSPSKEKLLPKVCKCPDKNFYIPVFDNNAELEKCGGDEDESESDSNLKLNEEKCNAEKMKLERELQYLREMLRSQTSRCESQQAEIGRLMYELRLNEEKCNETLRRLDLHLRIFQHLEIRTQQNDINSNYRDKIGSNVPETSDFEAKPDNIPPRKRLEAKKIDDEESSLSEDASRTSQFTEKSRGSPPLETQETKKPVEMESKKRFVNRAFLESSDENNGNEKPFEGNYSVKKLEEFQTENATGIKRKSSVENDSKFKPVGLTDSPLKLATSQKRKYSSSSLSTKLPSDSSIRFQGKESLSTEQPKETRQPKPKNRTSGSLPVENVENLFVTINILWFTFESSGSLWLSDKIKFFFIDFSFLDFNGAETETPESLPKPKSPEEKCYFNFSKRMRINESEKSNLQSLLNKPDMDIIIFKVVTDTENSEDENYECEDVGVAVLTVKQFIKNSDGMPIRIEVRNANNTKEIVGTLAVSVETAPEIFNARR